MDFKQVFGQVQAQVEDKIRQAQADALNPERLAKARESVTVLSGLVEVVRENVDNVLNDVQKGLLYISEAVSDAQSEVVEDAVKRETKDFDKGFSDWLDSMVNDEPVAKEKTAYTSKPDSSWSYKQKVEWLIANDEHWASTWKDEDPNLIVKDDSQMPEIVAHLRNGLIDDEVNRVWGEKFGS